MGGQAEGQACADPTARTPIGASRILYCYIVDIVIAYALPLRSIQIHHVEGGDQLIQVTLHPHLLCQVHGIWA